MPSIRLTVSSSAGPAFMPTFLDALVTRAAAVTDDQPREDDEFQQRFLVRALVEFDEHFRRLLLALLVCVVGQVDFDLANSFLVFCSFLLDNQLTLLLLEVPFLVAIKRDIQ